MRLGVSEAQGAGRFQKGNAMSKHVKALRRMADHTPDVCDGEDAKAAAEHLERVEKQLRVERKWNRTCLNALNGAHERRNWCLVADLIAEMKAVK